MALKDSRTEEWPFNTYLEYSQKIVEYVKGFYNEDGSYDHLPSLRQIARKFRIRIREVMDLVESTDTLMLAVGVQIGGGGGHFVYDTVADYEVEFVE